MLISYNSGNASLKERLMFHDRLNRPKEYRLVIIYPSK